MEITARPKGKKGPVATTDDEVGDMNIEDAKASGYTDKGGKAVDKARPNVEGSPTGALTDIGAGRSSAVKHEK
jgi:hypothetical protein